MIYCYDANACGNCASPYASQCSMNAYSTISRTCDNTTLSQRIQPSKYSGVQFVTVAQWTIIPSGATYNQIIANSTSDVNRTALVGDILGFAGLSIAKEISTDGSQDYRCTSSATFVGQFTCSVANLSSNGTTYRYILQTTIIQAIQIAPINIFYNIGNFNVQGTLTQDNVTTFSSSAILPVVYGIEWIDLVAPATANVNVMISFLANIYPVSKYLDYLR
jgi:hypothetical protein